MWQSGVGEWAGALRASGHREPGICWLGKKHLTWSPHSTPAPYSAHSQACCHVEINKAENFLCVIESPSPSPMFSGSRDVRSIPEAPEKFLRGVGALTRLLSDWFWVRENILRGDKHGRNMLKVQDNGCLVCECRKREMRWGSQVAGGGSGQVIQGALHGSDAQWRPWEVWGGAGDMMKVVLSNIASCPFQLGNTDSKCRAAWREAGDKNLPGVRPQSCGGWPGPRSSINQGTYNWVRLFTDLFVLTTSV